MAGGVCGEGRFNDQKTILYPARIRSPAVPGSEAVREVFTMTHEEAIKWVQITVGVIAAALFTLVMVLGRALWATP